MGDVMWPLSFVTVSALIAWCWWHWMKQQNGAVEDMALLRREVGQAVSRAETAADAFRSKANEVSALLMRMDGLEREMADVRDQITRLDNRTAKPAPRWVGER
jgi:methyl-accepting chemotaxis protein